MRPGIYLRGQVDYDAIEAVNYSTLKHMAQSPLHYLHATKHRKKSTRAMGQGTATHLLVLEPDDFEASYTVYPGPTRQGNAWKAFEAAAKAAGKMVLKQSELDLVLAMRDAVWSNPRAAEYLRGGHAEVVMVWVDEETGLLCKGRLDYLRDDSVPSDLKTTASVEHRFFSQNCAKMQYHVQSAFYSDAVGVLTKKQPESFPVIAVESKPPHDVVPYVLDADELAKGRDEYRRLLSKVKECRESGEWPGYANGLEMPLKLPAWVTPGDEGDDLELTINGESFSL